MPEPTPVRPIDLSGRVSLLSGECPLFTFELDQMDVYTTTDTEFAKGPCRDLKDDKKVRVDGWLMSDLRVRADKVTFDK